jgi:hypothetical protein
VWGFAQGAINELHGIALLCNDRRNSMIANTAYFGFTVEEQRQMQAATSQLEIVRRADPQLADLLQPWDSLSRVLQHLEGTTTTEILVSESRDEQRRWHDVGLFYQFWGRFHDAIAVYKLLYEKICECNLRDPAVWLPKGTPLVRLAECHGSLGHPAMSARYLLLTAVSDAVRDGGTINPEGGVYFRAISRGWTNDDLNEFYKKCFASFNHEDPVCVFPEQLVSKVSVPS